MKRVLWVEDDPGQFEPVKRLLLDRGISVTMVRDLDRAVHEMAQGEYELIILDNFIPDGRVYGDSYLTGEGPESALGDLHVGLKFLIEMRSRGMFIGRVMVLTFFLPPQAMLNAMFGVERERGNVVFVDKDSLKLGRLADDIEGLLAGPDSEALDGDGTGEPSGG